MYELKKKIGKVFTSTFVGTGLSSYDKRIYRVAVSQKLTNTSLNHQFGWEENSRPFKPRNFLSKQHGVTKTQNILNASFPILLFPEAYPVISQKTTPGTYTRQVGWYLLCNAVSLTLEISALASLFSNRVPNTTMMQFAKTMWHPPDPRVISG